MAYIKLCLRKLQIRAISMQYILNFIIIFLFTFDKFCLSQIKNDYLVSDVGINPAFVVDSNNNMHITWTSTEEGIFYLYSDSMGNPIQSPIKFYDSSLSNHPEIAINNCNLIVVWQKESFTYNSFIWGDIFTIGTDTLEDNFQFNDIYFDAKRFSPNVCFINDSIFIVVWSGEGPETISSTGVYGQLCSTQGNFIGNNILLSDHFGNNLVFSESRVLKYPNKDKFILIWRDDHLGNNMIFGREFYLNGSPIDSSFLISGSNLIKTLWFVSADMSNNGDFVVVWGAEFDDNWVIQWRWYNSECEPYSHVENITGVQDSVLEYSSIDVAINNDGNGVIVWEQLKDGYSRIYARRFISSRILLGNSFSVSSQRNINNQYFPKVDIINNKIYTIWKETEIWSNVLDYNNPPTTIKNTFHSIPFTNSTLINYPNPFNSLTKISYRISSPSYVKMKIFNCLGKEINTLVNTFFLPGKYSIIWDGQNSSNQHVASGIYFCQLEVNGVIVNTLKLKVIH